MLALISLVCTALTGYAYVGYPALVALIAKRAKPEGPYTALTPPVTLVIAAYNEQVAIAAKLRNVLELDYPAELLQVVLVTDGSTDGTEKTAQVVGGDRVLVLHTPERAGKAAAMTKGVAAAPGEIVVFSDANNLYPPDALREVLLPFADPEVGAVTGAKAVAGGAAEVSGGEKAYWRYESFIKKQESRLGCCTGVIGELFAVRRELVPSFPAGLVNDDFFMAMQVARAGRKVAYAPAALSIEPTAVSLAADGIRRRRIAAGRWQSLLWWRQTRPTARPGVVWQVASHKYLRLLLPFTMGGAFLAGAADLAFGQSKTLRKPQTALFVAQCVFYALAFAGNKASKPKIVKTAGGASRYLVRSNVASAQGLLYYLQDRKKMHLWERVGRAEIDSESDTARNQGLTLVD
jgi:biofilm PGA synthesis N-glycosyltransferase PgaC